MANAVEIANAYVALSVKMPGVKQDIKSELGRVDTRSIGDDLGRSTGKGFSLGFAAVAGAVGGIVSQIAGRAMDAIGGLVGEAAAASDATQKFAKTLGFAGLDTSTIEKVTQQTRAYADATVYGLGDIQNTTAQLAANGIKDYVELTEAAGNLNAVAGGNADTFKSVGMVLTQTAGQGKLTTENWNQLADAIPGASGKLQEALANAGAYTGNFRDAMSQGQITAEEFNAALLEVGTDPIAVEAAKSTETLEGALGNLQATIVGGLSDVFTTLKPQLTDAITGLSNVLGGFFDWFGGAFKGVVDLIANGDFTGAFADAFNVAEDSPIVDVILTIREGIVGVFDALKAGGDMSALADVLPFLTPFGLIFQILQPILPIVVGAFQQLAGVLSGVLVAVLPVIGSTLSSVATVFSQVLAQVLPLIIPLIVQFASIFRGLATAVLPQLLPMVTTLATFLGDVLMAVAPLVAQLVQAFLPVLVSLIPLFSTLLGAILPIITVILQALVPVIQFLAGVLVAVLTPILQAVAGAIQWVARDVLPVLGAAFEWLYENVIVPVWNGISDVIMGAWNWLDQYVFNPFKVGISLLGTAFENTAQAIATAWDGIKAAAAAPINFVLDTIWNNGLRSFWNDLVASLGLEDMKLPKAELVKFASGGVLPGWTPGRDVHQFYSPTAGFLALSGGEAIMRPEFTRAVGGAAGVEALNAAARRGEIGDGFGDFVGDVWENVQKAASVAWEFLSNPAAAIEKHVIDGIIRPLMGDQNVFGQAVGGLAANTVKGMADLFKAAAPSSPGGKGMGWESMWNIVRSRFPDATLNSALRPGAMTVNGGQSYHALGRAIDLPPRMDIFNWLKAAFPNSSELIYSPAGARQLLNGQEHFWEGAVRAQHYNHVHWAMANGGVMPKLYDQGGWLPHGGMALNLSGRPEAVLTPEESRALKNGGMPRELILRDIDGALIGRMRVEADSAAESRQRRAFGDMGMEVAEW
ncbi:MAG: 15, gp15 [Microbacterium sp.]|jgi:tape measure domain-containing protein|nr:15, gp15 [Microbacterium sp.]